MSFYYLATPYARYPGGPEKAFDDAANQAACLISAGIPVFCPITHTHPIHRYINPLDAHRFWLDFDRAFMEVAKGLIVCQLTSWEQSRGIQEEIDYFRMVNKPIILMKPGEIPQELITEPAR